MNCIHNARPHLLVCWETFSKWFLSLKPALVLLVVSLVALEIFLLLGVLVVLVSSVILLISSVVILAPIVNILLVSILLSFILE